MVEKHRHVVGAVALLVGAMQGPSCWEEPAVVVVVVVVVVVAAVVVRPCSCCPFGWPFDA